jgi:hypothetical protein
VANSDNFYVLGSDVMLRKFVATALAFGMCLGSLGLFPIDISKPVSISAETNYGSIGGSGTDTNKDSANFASVGGVEKLTYDASVGKKINLKAGSTGYRVVLAIPNYYGTDKDGAEAGFEQYKLIKTDGSVDSAALEKFIKNLNANYATGTDNLDSDKTFIGRNMGDMHIYGQGVDSIFMEISGDTTEVNLGSWIVPTGWSNGGKAVGYSVYVIEDDYEVYHNGKMVLEQWELNKLYGGVYGAYAPSIDRQRFTIMGSGVTVKSDSDYSGNVIDYSSLIYIVYYNIDRLRRSPPLCGGNHRLYATWRLRRPKLRLGKLFYCIK